MLYIHIPLCDSKCPYCAFNSFANIEFDEKAYLIALLSQFKLEKKRFELGFGAFKSVYIGGGTPSTLSVDFYEKFFEAVMPYFAKDAEITVEANPNSASLHWLRGLFAAGANRLSLGVQSLDDAKLKFLGRAHNSAYAVTAVENARKAGFRNISVDLMYDTVFDDERFLTDELSRFTILESQHISAYSLTVEEGTPFERLGAAKLKPTGDGLGKFVAHRLVDAGHEHYEVTNFVRFRSRHNSEYWQHADYIGLGAGAVGFLKNKRLYPHKNIAKYLESPCEISEERLSSEQLLTEKLFLGFRSFVGVQKELLNAEQAAKAQTLLDAEKLYERDGRLFAYDFFLADELALFLL